MSMIMPKGTRQLLLPASLFFIWSSLVVSFFINIANSVWFFQRLSWQPDILFLTLIFWTIHQNQRIGLWTTFFFGLLVDIQSSSLLGQHAFSYTLASFFALLLHRRILWFKLPTQSLHILPLLALSHLVQAVSRFFFSGDTTDFFVLLAPIVEAALWPLLSFILLMPQRRSPDPDATRVL
jgi:rod shape-determining protein MreD